MDELPRLLNVICGQMSLVGPRLPTNRHDEVSDVVAHYASQRGLKPGLASWSQVRGLPADPASVQETNQRIEFERWYIDNWSVWLDLKIVLRSFLWRIPSKMRH
jgi:undecaprenyl-phosphate galactose phosphotransferase/putative colanic acid biosynthesis UDP-glucose lipid carrier transferase